MRFVGEVPEPTHKTDGLLVLPKQILPLNRGDITWEYVEPFFKYYKHFSIELCRLDGHPYPEEQHRKSFIQKLTWLYDRLGKLARDAIWPEAKRLIREYLVDTEGLGHLEPPNTQKNVHDFFRQVNTTVTEKGLYPLCLLIWPFNHSIVSIWKLATL